MSRHRMKLFALIAAVTVLVGASVCPAADVAKSKLPLSSANTIVTVRIKSIDAAIKALSELVAVFEPDAEAAIQMRVNAELQRNLPGIDPAAPVAILFLDPKKFDEPGVGVFTLKDAEAFKNGVQGPMVRVVGKLGIIAGHEGALTEVADAIKAAGVKAVPVADMKDLAVASADVGALFKRYKMDIQGALKMLKMQITGAMPGAEPAPNAPPDPKKQMALRAIDYAGKLFAEIENQAGLAEMGLSVNKNQINGRFTAEAVPGSPFATFLKKNDRPAKRALANFLPQDAVSTTIVSHDPASFGELWVGLVAIACDIFGVGAEETKSITKVVEDAAKNMSGLSASAEVVVEGGTGGVGLQGIKDKEAARASTKASVGLTGVGTLGDFLKKYGVSITLTEKHREHQGIPIDKLEIAVDLDKLTNEIPVPVGDRAQFKETLAEAMKTTYGYENKIVIETAYGKRLVTTAYGLDHAKLMNKQIELMKARGAGSIGNTPEYNAALNGHPKRSFAFSHVSLFGKINAIGDVVYKHMALMMMQPAPDFFPTRAELPAEEQPISASMRVEANKAVMEIHVPTQPIKAVADVFKRKMMEQMMQQMPGPGMMPPMPEDFE